MIEALKDKDDDVRLSAAIGLGYFGEQAKDAIPALQAAQRDRDARVREAAGVALSRIDPAQFPRDPIPAEENEARTRRRHGRVRKIVVRDFRGEAECPCHACLHAPRFWRTLRYRLCVTGVCFAYLLTALEIPLPVFDSQGHQPTVPLPGSSVRLPDGRAVLVELLLLHAGTALGLGATHHVEPPAYAEKPVEQPAADGWNTVKLRDRDRHDGKELLPAKGETSSCCRPPETLDDIVFSKSGGFAGYTTLAVWRMPGILDAVGQHRRRPARPSVYRVVSRLPSLLRAFSFSRYTSTKVPSIPPDSSSAAVPQSDSTFDASQKRCASTLLRSVANRTSPMPRWVRPAPSPSWTD